MVTLSRGLGSLIAALGVVALAATITPARAQSPCGAILDDCIDDFTCYGARTTPGTARFATVPGVTLVDQFETVTASVAKQQHLCTPTDKNQEGLLDPDTHLVSYAIKRQSPRHVARTAIRVTNQLGEIRVNTIRPEILLVPTAKDLSMQPSAPNPTGHRLDHYKCYRVRVTPGSPQFANGTTVQAEDQFSANRLLSLVKPRHLCTPVNKNGEGVTSSHAHYLCYSVRPAIGSPKHLRRLGLFINNQFGPLRLDTIKEKEFCIPSTKSF
jgi:hypothetical protein